MSFRMDTSKSKVVFKKRAHRPWQTNLLDEGTEDNQNVLDVFTKTPDKQLELLQRQLEGTLEIKSRERDEINHTLKTLDDHRVTFGGFLKPKDILLVTEHESLKKTSSLIIELKEKEQEIVEITQNLKITQAEETAERAEAARLMEEKARHAAEEKAIFALRQAHLTAEQIKEAEGRVLLMEQAKLKLEHHLFDLEEKLKLTTHELTVLGQKSKLTEENEANLETELKILTKKLNDEKQDKINLKENLLQEIQDIKQETQLQIEELQEKLREQIDQVEDAKNKRLELEQQFSHKEQTYIDMENALSSVSQLTLELQEQIHTIKFERDEMKSHLQKMETKLDLAYCRQTKMIELIGLERNLRIMFEEKLKDAITEIGKTELRRRAESEARRMAEEKTKHTIEQAGKAMIQLLHSPTLQDKETIDS